MSYATTTTPPTLDAAGALHLSLASDPSVIPDVFDTVCAFVAERGFDITPRRMALQVGVHEMVGNAMMHGNEESDDLRVDLSAYIKDRVLVLTVRDEGDGFSPDDLPDPFALENLERPCGRGVALTRKVMDSVSFNDPGNEVTMLLNLAAE